MKNLVHSYDKIVFGSNLCAVMYAFTNQLPLFYSSFEQPKYFEHFDPQYQFSDINIDNSILCNGKIKNLGMKKADLWERLAFIHGLEGLMPLGNGVSSCRIDEDVLKVTTKNSRVIRIKFNHLFIFDENVEGLPPIIKTINEGLIYDHVKFDTLHEYKKMLIETKDNLANKVWIDGNKAIMVSKTKNIIKKLPEDYEIRFRILELAKEYGLKGRQNGIYHYKKELKIPRFKKLDIKITTREIQKTKFNIYRPQDGLTFIEPCDILESTLLEQLVTNRLWKQLKLSMWSHIQIDKPASI